MPAITAYTHTEAMPEPVIEERARARAGRTLNGKYRLDRLIGMGGMSSVYAATHRNNKRVAVKVLHTELSVHPGLRARFMREGYVANTVDHPGAVAVLDDDVTEDGAAFLVMELLEGETLADACDRQGGRLPVRAVLAVAFQVLDVLAAADAKHVVHRDIKPANLFLTRTGQVKVLDFGVARMREAGVQDQTTTELTLGTPAFMAPEQALGRSHEIDGLTDVWALGATMFALLTGGPVHVATSPQEQMVFAATRSPRPLAQVEPDIGPEVAELVDRALAFHRSARWPSAAAMRDAVRDVYRAQHGEDPSPSALVFMASPERTPVSERPGRPPSPMASTVQETPVSLEPRRLYDHLRGPSPTSLVPTASRPRSMASRPVQLLTGVVLLLLVTGGLAVWSATRVPGRTTTAGATAANALMSVAVSVPSVSASASAATAPAATASSASASVSVTPSASASSAPPLHLRPRPGPSATSTTTPVDRFDHQ